MCTALELRRFKAILPGLGLLLLGACAAANEDKGWVPIFDGETLSGWRASPESLAAGWSVKDGAIQGHGIEDRQAYLVYSDNQDLSDFELKLSYRMLTDGNTGVELRARVDTTGKRPFEGYHADLGHVGIGPSILGAWDFHFATRKEFPCERGTSLTINEDGTAHFEKLENHVRLVDLKRRDWNRCHIVAAGNRFRFSINGVLSAEFVDGIRAGSLDSGLIALQIHEKGTTVQFKDISLKQLR
jgi:hypothetical protein